jgi:hypothetical protein
MQIQLHIQLLIKFYILMSVSRCHQLTIIHVITHECWRYETLGGDDGG